MKKSTQLRRLLSSGSILVAPGVFDGLSAKLVERAGFSCVYASGDAIARSAGYPDMGLLTLTEVLDRLRLIVESTMLPVIADADTTVPPWRGNLPPLLSGKKLSGGAQRL